MVKKLFTCDLYIKISANKFDAKNLSTNGSWQTAYPDQPFTTDRLLIGHFSSAESTLTQLIKNILPKSFIAKSPQVVIHPTSHVEGGLSEVEEHIFKELALGSGAHKAALHIGSELTDSGARILISRA